MTYQSIKWIVFTALALTVPAVFFLVMVVMFMPAVFFVAGIGYVIPKLFAAGSVGESMSFIVIMGVHALIYAALYYGLSVAIARALHLIRSQLARVIAVAAVCLGLGSVTLFPVYGAGGHGPTRWFTLVEFLTDVNKSYGTGSAQLVYGTAILLLSVFLFFKMRRGNRTQPGG